jgi:lipoprotein-anchoring transpeptidase ErfK/SrfK
MPIWMRSALIRFSGTVGTALILMLMTAFSWSSITSYAENTTADATIASQKNTGSRSDYIAQSRRIEIDLSEQRLRAWDGKNLVYSFRISTGKRSTPTPVGRFAINSKYRINRMRGRGYDIPDVPYAMYFYGGYAIHGAYWHNRFGTPVSRGCINLPVNQARKLYNWAGIGTTVVVRQ